MYGDAHGISFLLDPRYMGEKMSHTDKDKIIDFVTETFPYTCAGAKFSARTEWMRWKRHIEDTKELYPHRLKNLDPSNQEISLYDWWRDQPDEFAHLKEIALVVFSMPVSSASCERTFSSWSFIHNKLRTRLDDARVIKLVYVYVNMQQLDNKRKRPMEISDDDHVDFTHELEIEDG